MSNELRKRFPSHSGLNADWSVCAWHIGYDWAGEVWLLEDEEANDGTFEVVSRAWNEAEDCWVSTVLESGVSVEEAAVLLGVNA